MRQSPGDASLKVVGGYYLLATGDLATARGVFGEVLQAEPRNVDALLGSAAAALQDGQHAEAEKLFQRALAAEPKSERAYLGLAATAIARADRAAAAQWLEKAISADPSVVESRLQLADQMFRGGDAAKAMALIDQALAATKARAATLDRAGQVLLRANRVDAALQRFNEAASLGNERASLNAAMALVSLGRVDDARVRLEAAARGRPAWVAPTAMLVHLDIAAKSYDRALDRLTQLEKAGAPGATVDELRGDTLFAAGRMTQALEAYDRAARLRPGAALSIKVYRAARAGGRERPEAVLLDWLKTHPSDALVRVALAEHYQAAGDRRGAIAQYEQAVKVLQAPALLNNLAWLYQEAGDPRAQELARRAYQEAPENHGIADTYGWILLNSGNIGDSLPILEKAARGEPGSAEVQYHYAAALAKAGQKEAAATVLRKLFEQNASFSSRSAAQALLESLK
jgi:putative PEP-CTERM system TPR-repeat lipoprotein